MSAEVLRYAAFPDNGAGGTPPASCSTRRP